MSAQERKIRLSDRDAGRPWTANLRREAETALVEAQTRLGLVLDAPPLVESIAPESAFYEALGTRPHNLLAVAYAHDNRIVINRARFVAIGAAERRNTLIHEFTHLLLGRCVPGGVPRWLNEGLAMVTAGERSFGYHTRLAVAASFGNLIPLQDLWTAAGMATDSQELAYAQSLSATRFLLRIQTGEENPDWPEARKLARRLADREEGKHLRNQLYNPDYLRNFERLWKESIRNFWTVVAALTGGGALWMGMTWLFLIAYWRKKRMARLKELEWEEEELYGFNYDPEWEFEWEDEESF